MSATPNYRRYRFPSEIIAQAVWLYHRFKLSFRDVEDLLAERGITVSYEIIRQWCRTFGPQYARRIKRRLGPRGDRWFLTSLSFRFRASDVICGEPMTRTVILSISSCKKSKDTQAAKRFFRKLLCSQARAPLEIVTDKLPSYAAAKRELMSPVRHCRDRFANNRAEVSHEHTREQERQMRGFRSDGHAQRFLSVHGQRNNLFRLGRHLLRAVNYRAVRSGAFQTSMQLTCAQ